MESEPGQEDYSGNVLNFYSRQAKVSVSQEQDVNLTEETPSKKNFKATPGEKVSV